MTTETRLKRRLIRATNALDESLREFVNAWIEANKTTGEMLESRQAILTGACRSLDFDIALYAVTGKYPQYAERVQDVVRRNAWLATVPRVEIKTLYPGTVCTCSDCPTCHAKTVCATCGQCARCATHADGCKGCPGTETH